MLAVSWELERGFRALASRAGGVDPIEPCLQFWQDAICLMRMARLTGPIIAGCWAVFIVFWTVSAFGQKRTAERGSFLRTLAYRLPLVIGAMLLWFPRLGYPLNLRLNPGTDLTRSFGAMTCVCGLLVTLWARWTLAGNWSSEVAFKRGHELVRTGPYRFVRHPIYSGLLLMCLGTAAAVGLLRSWLGFVLLCVGFWIKLKQEERLLLRHFPDEYRAYQGEVKALVPFMI